MKILHVNSGTDGGAALCAIRINKSLVAIDVESKMLFANCDRIPDGVEGSIVHPDRDIWYSNPILGKIKHLLMRMPWYMDCEKMEKQVTNCKTYDVFTDIPYSNYTHLAYHPLIKWADIIHLHWVSGLIDYPTFFRKIKKPIVWTLHDEYPAIGLMHFCSEYSPLPVQLRDIDQYCREVKKKALSKNINLHTVAISERMKELCLSSDILNNYPCTLIHNGVDTEIFRPYLVEDAKIMEKHTKVFLFSSYNIWDKRKGLDRIIDALEMVDIEKKLVVLGDNHGTILPQASFPVICKGLIKDEIELSKIYSSVDYFIQASFQEAFAQTPLEAMSCGIPVISTPVSGASDLIRPFNGVLCKGFDSNSIKDGIMQALAKKYDSQQIRDYIIDKFDYSKIAKQYIDLYTSIIIRCAK